MIDGTIAACLVLALPASAQSSKFAATYDTDVEMIEVSVNGGLPVCIVDLSGVTQCEATAGPFAEAEVAEIHVANWKEILGTMSGQVNLVTFTQAKGKNGGGTSTAIAEGTVRASMLVLPEGTGSATDCAEAFVAYDIDNNDNRFAAPGPITFASRRQQLSVTVDLDVIDDPLVDCSTTTCVGDTLDITGSVTVALGLDTTAAHSVQFIAADMSQGTYDIVACYDLSALAEVSGQDIDVDTAANSKVALGPRMITVQEVRATKNGIIDETGAEE